VVIARSLGRLGDFRQALLYRSKSQPVAPVLAANLEHNAHMTIVISGRAMGAL
jgi:hypothetical protein